MDKGVRKDSLRNSTHVCVVKPLNVKDRGYEQPWRPVEKEEDIIVAAMHTIVVIPTRELRTTLPQ